MSHSYLAHTPDEREKMFQALAIESADDLFSVIPQSLQNFDLNLPAALSELELQKALKKIGQRNQPVTEQKAFIGAGAYQHFVPAALDPLILRSEFLTAYTPYQAEISQGTLQVIYEFQSKLCTLTGMDIANASTYEGATATAEALLMAKRITRRNHFLLSPLLHPEYREVLETYCQAMDIEWTTLPLSDAHTHLEQSLSVDEPAALVIQYPNFFGTPEDLQYYADWIHARKGLLIVVMNDLTTLGLLEAPGNLGADIVAGEAQSLGNSLSFGGPYLGFLTAKAKYIRQMPGRMSGQTVDEAGQSAFTLVLQTREQHIRRERATSNICTNQGLNALIASIWLSLIGKQGLQEIADICLQRAHFLADAITQIPGFRLFSKTPFFHEFVVETDYPLDEVMAWCQSKQLLPGLPLSSWYPELNKHLLITVTEMNSAQDLADFIQTLNEFSQRT